MATRRWKLRFRYGEGQAYMVEENGACKYVNTSTLKSIYERGGKCAKWLITASVICGTIYGDH